MHSRAHCQVPRQTRLREFPSCLQRNHQSGCSYRRPSCHWVMRSRAMPSRHCDTAILRYCDTASVVRDCSETKRRRNERSCAFMAPSAKDLTFLRHSFCRFLFSEPVAGLCYRCAVVESTSAVCAGFGCRFRIVRSHHESMRSESLMHARSMGSQSVPDTTIWTLTSCSDPDTPRVP